MGWRRATYQEVRGNMAPGDVIAFGGNRFLSDVFKWITRSCVSHSGVIMQTKLFFDGAPREGFFNQIIESTEYNGFIGVQANRLSSVIADYDGSVWWLPLSVEVRKKLDLKKFYDFLIHQVGKPFDIADSAELMFDTLINKSPDIKEDFRKFFCSELVVAGLEAGGALPAVDCSDITPADLCKLKLYTGDYYQLKGDDQEIKRYNTIPPEVLACQCARPPAIKPEKAHDNR